MPTYEYRCNSCGEHVEVFQSFQDDPLQTCGICGGELKRVFHPVGIVFKGSGFYSTDSKSSSAGRGATGGGDLSKAPAPAVTQSDSPTSSDSSESATATTSDSSASSKEGSESSSGEKAKIA